jgi:hypothetical protein
MSDKKKKLSPEEVNLALRSTDVDPLGMYTGVPDEDLTDKPIQDADDL